jgi:hypothetical protein
MREISIGHVPRTSEPLGVHQRKLASPLPWEEQDFEEKKIGLKSRAPFLRAICMSSDGKLCSSIEN